MKNFAMLSMFLFACTAGEGLGSSGEMCYQNNTCLPPNTCFRIGDEARCYLEVKPVVLDGAKVCYTFNPQTDAGAETDEQTKCFDTLDECLSNFGTMLKIPGRVVRGCAYQQ